MRVTKTPQERRAELIAAARALFDLHGVDKTRVSDIVHKVGVAQGVFYYYFTSKEELVNAVVEQVTQELIEKTDAVLADDAMDFCRKLAAFIEMYIDVVDQFLADDEMDIGALSIDFMREDTLTVHMQGILLQRLQLLVEQGAEQGVVTARYPRETALVLVYGLSGYARRQLPGRHMMYSIAEQALGLAKGELVRYADMFAKK